MIKRSVASLSGPGLINENQKCLILQNIGGIKISTDSESFFVILSVNFSEIQQGALKVSPPENFGPSKSGIFYFELKIMA